MASCKITNKGDLWKSYQSTWVLLSIYDSISIGNYEKFGSPVMLKDVLIICRLKSFHQEDEETSFCYLFITKQWKKYDIIKNEWLKMNGYSSKTHKDEYIQLIIISVYLDSIHVNSKTTGTSFRCYH